MAEQNNKQCSSFRASKRRNKRIKTILLCFSALLSSAVTTQLYGFEQAKVNQKALPEGLETITVTARKRNENLQETPISISSFSASELEYKQINSSDQLTQITPNLSFSSHAPSAGNNASSQVFIRGIGQTEFLPTTDPGVGLYIDDVYMARSVGATLDFIDLQQVEILRGPQGTLFGRNTIGGAISLQTRRPSDEFKGYVDVKIGTDNKQEIKGSVDIPISNELLTSFSVGLRARDGYVNRLLDSTVLGDDDSKGGRMAVEWLLSQNLNLYWTLDFVKEQETGSPIVFNGLAAGGAFANAAKNNANTGCASTTFDAEDLRDRCLSNHWDAGPYANYGTGEVASLFKSWGTSLILNADFKHFSLKSITAYRDMQWTGARDADNTPLVILHTRNTDTQNQFSQELQLTGRALKERLNWLAGIYYFEEQASDDYLLNVAVGTINSGGRVKNDSSAIFGQLTYDFTEQLALTIGARYTQENKGFKPLQYSISSYVFPVASSEVNEQAQYLHPFNGDTYPTIAGGALAVIPGGVDFFPREFSREKYTDITPMFNLSYKIDSNAMVYLGYSEGFKSGGYNARHIKPGIAVRRYDPENAATYEVGLKADLLDNSLRLNTALFNTEYTDLQFVIREDFAPIVFNAGKAKIKGLEVEMTWLPTEHLEITGSLGYIDAEYTELSQSLQEQGVGLKNKMPHVPKINSSLGLAYIYPLTHGGVISPRIDWSYRDDVYFDALNSEEITQEAYSTVNASVNWVSPNDTYSVTFAITNLNDELYKVAGNTALNSASSYSEAVYARGREWMLGGKYRF